MGADIFFEDEAGIGIMTRSGHTWGALGSPPTVFAIDRRGDYNILSAIGIDGKSFYYRIEDGHIAGEQYIRFLKEILIQHPRPIIIIADRVRFRTSKQVREFVRFNRRRIRIFFLPRHAPDLNPGEQIWGETKYRKLGRESIFDKEYLKRQLMPNLASLRKNSERLLSFSCLKSTSYVLA